MTPIMAARGRKARLRNKPVGMVRGVSIALALALGVGQAMAGDFFTLKGHGGPVKGIAAAADGRILTASFDNSVGLWRDGVPLWLEGHSAAVNEVLFLPDGRILSGGDDFELRVWDPNTGVTRAMNGHAGKIMGLAVSPDGRRAASASWDGQIGLWDLSAHDGSAEVRPVFLNGHTSGVNAVAFSADGAVLYSGSTDGSLRVWDVATGAQIRQLVHNGFGINRLVLNETDGWIAYGAIDGVTRVIDLATGAQVRDLTLERRPILALAASPDFGLLAIGDGEGYISIVETETWGFVADFRATLRGPVWALAFSPDGTNVHAGGLDTAMYSWPVTGLRNGERMVAEVPSYLVPASAVSNGERQYNRKCSICHALGPDGQRRAGPTLHGIFGRKAGTLARYPYSETLRRSSVVWGDDTIDALFDQGPDTFITGSKMPEQRITDPQDRADLIAFLRTATLEPDNREE
ncbi:MAG: c-type cytochrome [Pseudomonadota bacterium]